MSLTKPRHVEVIVDSEDLRSQLNKSLTGRDLVKINDIEYACISSDGCNRFVLMEIRRVCALNATKAEWTGEGLPPVGIDVEISNESGRGVVQGAEHFIGSTCKVMATFTNMHGYEIVSVEDSSGACMCFRSDMCRPARTPEQIAAEEREKAIDQMLADADTANKMQTINAVYFGALYDAGYRKKVKP